ncbi:MAG: trigger factor [Victivallaceae bacterium]|nr:trigger factor [Victivallaceae bacterium]
MGNSKLGDNLMMSSKEDKACQKAFLFVADRAAVTNEVQNIVREFSGMVVIPGFRKGKAPAPMLIRRYNKEVLDELQRKLYRAAFDKVIADQSLDIVSYGTPRETAPLKLDDEYRFSIAFDLAPEIDLPEYQGIEVEAAPAEVTDEDVGKQIDYYRNMYANYADIETAAQPEDMLKVSYTSDFELPEDASLSLKRQVAAESNWLWLNEPELIPGAIKALTGAEKGGEYKFEAVYPENWRDPELAGKQLNYQVKVLNVQRRNPLTDEEVAAKMKFESIAEMREMFGTVAKNEAEKRRHAEISRKVYEVLDGKIGKFDLPPNIFADQVQNELHRMAQGLKSEAEAEAFKKDLETHRKEAEKAATLKLRRIFIMRKIAKLEKISVEQHEIDGQIRGMSTRYGYHEKEFRSMLEKVGGLEEMHLDMLAVKVANFLADQAKVKEKPAAAKKTEAETG